MLATQASNNEIIIIQFCDIPGVQEQRDNEKMKKTKRNEIIFFQDPLKKRESIGVSFLYWLDLKSKHFNWNINEWNATQPSSRLFSQKLSKWEPCKSCIIQFKPL